jgi:hypothetical protein
VEPEGLSVDEIEMYFRRVLTGYLDILHMRTFESEANY